jgi:hypothetical protein
LGSKRKHPEETHAYVSGGGSVCPPDRCLLAQPGLCEAPSDPPDVDPASGMAVDTDGIGSGPGCGDGDDDALAAAAVAAMM